MLDEQHFKVKKKLESRAKKTKPVTQTPATN